MDDYLYGIIRRRREELQASGTAIQTPATCGQADRRGRYDR